jgi:hypothetical protein
LGPDSISVFYYQLAKIGIDKRAIAKNPEQFVEALAKMLGSASGMVQMRILRALEENATIAESPSISQFAEVMKNVSVSTFKGRKDN